MSDAVVKINIGFVVASMLFWFTGCTSMDRSSSDRLTVGTVQKEIHKGMDAASVAAALGSPNIVTSDENDGEVWIYDKISSNVRYSKSQGYGTLLLIGIGGEEGRSSSSQRTLTIIIKFNKYRKVKSFKYHTSRF